MKDIDEIQRFLREHQIDGWLLYDFRESNPIARSVAGITASGITRRWFCYVPSDGDAVWLIHRIERAQFSDVVGEVREYTSWRELHEEIRTLTANPSRVAMEYSPNAAIPYVSRVDAGTIELIRSFGVEVVSSADLVQLIEARWTADQLAGHRESARLILEAKEIAFAWIGEQLRSDRRTTEYDVQSLILERFDAMDLTAGHPPIVAVNANASNPHYSPTAAEHQPIRQGDFVLIDLWAKQKTPDAVFADTTWVGYAGKTVPERYVEVFEIVRDARDLAVAFIREKVASDGPVYGYAVDDVVRNHITEKGYGAFFIHRTGHSIGTEIHGNGVNIDNLETKDERALIPGICFSIEPGIYLPEFGIRSEIDVFLAHLAPDGVIVTTVPAQTEVLTLL
ncbi:MAG: Xaa-Pro peptidase family protein [Candidatus Poribacteria bacterium]|nr:Xaa-Pro peptidase family protein [Candidatus Poribacteria bacterium]